MRNVFGSILLIALCSMAQHASADTYLGIINLELKGTVISSSCDIAVGSDSKTVDLGNWATKDLSKVGHITHPVKFTISLTRCPKTRSVGIRFDGQSAPGHSDLIALNGSSTASNVAIELKDGNADRLSLMHYSPATPVDANGNATLDFSANIIATGTPVGAGTTNADITFIIGYY